MGDARGPVVAAAFASPEAVVEAAAKVRALGYVSLEAYTPFPVPELDEVLAIPRGPIPRLAWLAGAAGATLAVAVQWWCNAYDYPLDVGGRPLASWPTYVIIAFELTVLFAAVTCFAAVLLLSRLPRLHDPIFDVEGIESASVDRFWLAIRDVDREGDDVAALQSALAQATSIEGLGDAPRGDALRGGAA